jgi:hypothetical protein
VLSVTPGNTGVYLGSLDSVEKIQIVSSQANAVYAPSGHLLFDQGGTLMVQPFDARAGTRSGQAFAFDDRVLAAPGPGYLVLSIASDGAMAYWNGRAPTTELQWFDRNGRPLDKVGPAKPYQSPALSQDGSNLLITEHVTPGRNELVKIDLSNGVTSQLTFPAGEFSFARFGIWSPDGKVLLYSSSESDGPRWYRMAAGGSQQEQSFRGPTALFPEDWSRDWLVYNAFGPTGAGVDVWAFNFADRKHRPIVEDPFHQLQARLSPDGRWLAYTSDETGSWEVYVRPFPEGLKRPISTATGGGSQPVWSSRGNELFYVAADNRLFAVPIVGSDTLKVGVSQPLFPTRLPPVVAPWRTNYAVSADGRFLLNNVLPTAAAPPITIVVNGQERWKK